MEMNFEKEFFALIDKVNFNLLEDLDNFYGYFLLQMAREIRYDISSPTAVNFKSAKYVLYFNPTLFLQLDTKQMESTIKHEILHIVSQHLTRAKELEGKYSKLAINMAMDIPVNELLNPLPPYAVTLRTVNSKYGLKLDHYGTIEYYAEKLQIAMDLMDGEEVIEGQNSDDEILQPEFEASKTHDLWEESDEVDEKTLLEFTEKIIHESQKGEIPVYLADMIAALKKSKGELPWNLYLKRLMGIVLSDKKKTITRRNRRQPDRLDLRGQLNSHKAKIVVAIDTSGSISDEEFKQAMIEVLSIIKNYGHEITVVECDDQIRQTYKVRSDKDLKDRMNTRGATRFSPVFEYANSQRVNLLIYFTDGKGEDKLTVTPKGYKVLWVISGNGDKLSLNKPYGVVKKLSLVEIKDGSSDYFIEKGGYSMNNPEAMC